MIKSYRNLCSVEVNTLEADGSYYSRRYSTLGFSPDNSDGVCFSPAHYSKVCVQLNNCKAAIMKEHFVHSTGALSVREGTSLTKVEGIGSFQSVCTNQHIYLLELEDSEIFISPKFLLGYVGNVTMDGFRNLVKKTKAAVSLTSAGRVGRTDAIVGLGSFLEHCTPYTLNGLSRNFIALKGSGFVILTFPFPLSFLQEVEQTKDTMTARTKNLVYFTTPNKVFFTEDNGLCTINGQCKICTSMIEDASE